MGWIYQNALIKHVRWTPHPVIVTIMDNKEYIRVLLYSYYTTTEGGRSRLKVSLAQDRPTYSHEV